MKIEKVTKPAFAVIGKEGSTSEGPGFIERLWQSANGSFGEIAHLAVKNERGFPIGVWGAMSDFSRAFLPWEDNFSKGLYLAGAECCENAEAPEGWTKWIIPTQEYLVTEMTETSFPEMIGYLAENGLSLSGAVHDFTNPETGKNYQYFPIRRL